MDVDFSVQFAEGTTYFAMDGSRCRPLNHANQVPSWRFSVGVCVPRIVRLHFDPAHSVVVLDRKRGFASSVLSAGGNPRLYLRCRRKQNRANEL